MWQGVVLATQPTKLLKCFTVKEEMGRTEKGMMMVKTKWVVCLDER
jgi:hypothetical protein